MNTFIFEPMFAVLGLSGGELILIFLTMLICPMTLAVIVGLIIWLVRRNDRKVAPPQPLPSATKRFCPQCGREMSADAPQGLCPACLMNVALGSEGGNAAASGERKPAPPPAEIAGQFPQLEILELLGQGGMGMVYKARQPQLDRLVALKILSPELSRDPAFAERFNREARALARLNHPNIVSVFDFGKAGEFYYFIMEYVDGANLWQLERAKKRLAPEEALAIVPKICDALQYAHDEGIVHRDIKPGNILLDKKGRVKIADFGLAKLVGKHRDDFSITQSRMTLGTPQYMAPEQFEDPQKVDHRADIYSLGVVFYEMLTGELPMGRFAPPSQKVSVDVRIDEVVLKSLEKEPQRRYQQASEIKTDVETLAGVIEKLPPQVRAMYSGYEYKSKTTLWGLPLVHVAYGMDPKTGKSRVAKGIIAIGSIAKGVIAIGGTAIGGFAFGGGAIGVIAVGGGAFGLIAMGGGAIALLFAFGGGAAAPIAIGGGAVGIYAMGGGAYGPHPFGGNAQDEAARRFFTVWVGSWLDWLLFALITAPMLFPLIASFFMFGKRSGKFFGDEHARRQVRRTLLGTGAFMVLMWVLVVVPTLPNLKSHTWGKMLREPSQPQNVQPDPAAKLKLQQTEQQLQRIETLYNQNLVSQEEFAAARLARDLAAAELNGNSVEVARLRFDHARVQFERAKELFDKKLVSQSEFDQAKAQFDDAQLEYEKLAHKR